MIPIDNPLKWLLAELPAYVPPDRLLELMARYDAQKTAYYAAVKMRDLKRKITSAQRWPSSENKTERIARWQAQLDRLKEEGSDLPH